MICLSCLEALKKHNMALAEAILKFGIANLLRSSTNFNFLI